MIKWDQISEIGNDYGESFEESHAREMEVAAAQKEAAEHEAHEKKVKEDLKLAK